MPQLFANNATSTLAVALTNVATSLSLKAGDGAKFPTPAAGEFFELTLIGRDANGVENAWEVVKVTQRSIDTLTIVRAQEGSTAAAWGVGTPVQMRVTTGTLQRFAQLDSTVAQSFTTTPKFPTAAQGTNDIQAATTQFVATAVAQAKADIVASSPAALDTLNEFAAALGNDANYAATTATALGNRLRVDTAAQGLSAQQQANAKTNLALVKADVGLGNVDNTSDANKPISAATQNALNLKAPNDSPTFTGPVTATGRTNFGKAGQSGQYAATFWPDTSGNSVFNLRNDTGALRLIIGSDPYNAGAVEALRVDYTGAVGIGTNAPTSKLHLHGGGMRVDSGSSAWAIWNADVSSSALAGFRVGNATVGYIGADNGGIVSGGTGTNFGIRAEHDLIMAAGGLETGRFTASGNFGVGNNSPVAKLHIGAVGNSGATLASTIGFDGYSTSAQYRLIINHNNGGLLGIGSDGAGSMIFGRCSDWIGTPQAEYARFDMAGNLLVGATTSAGFGARHRITTVTSEGGAVLSVENGGSFSTLFIGVSSGGYNSTNAAQWVGKNSSNGRSINAAGTINASGADYAEYMTKADTCGVLAKGQIVGVNTAGQLTDKWAEAVSFLVKSTDPSYVGGDVWGSEAAIGQPRPEQPLLQLPDYTGSATPGNAPIEPGAPEIVAPVEPAAPASDATDEEVAAYQAACAQYRTDLTAYTDAQTAYQGVLSNYHVAKAAYDTALAQYQADQAAYEQAVADARHQFDTVTMPAYESALTDFNVLLEAARQKVDRIAYCGQVPVNVTGATPGQYIVPAQDGEGIKGVLIDKASLSFEQYIAAVGVVQNVLPDGRANVRVKPV